MTAPPWALPAVIVACSAAILAAAFLPRRWRERAAWRRITREEADLDKVFADIWEEGIDRLQDEIAETLRRIRDCTEGGGT